MILGLGPPTHFRCGPILIITVMLDFLEAGFFWPYVQARSNGPVGGPLSGKFLLIRFPWAGSHFAVNSNPVFNAILAFMRDG